MQPFHSEVKRSWLLLDNWSKLNEADCNSSVNDWEEKTPSFTSKYLNWDYKKNSKEYSNNYTEVKKANASEGQRKALEKWTASVSLSAIVSFHWHLFSIYFLLLQAGPVCKDIQTRLPRLPLALLSGILQKWKKAMYCWTTASEALLLKVGVRETSCILSYLPKARKPH